MKIHLLTSWMLEALSFTYDTLNFSHFFFNGFFSFDDEDASFDFLDNCYFGL